VVCAYYKARQKALNRTVAIKMMHQPHDAWTSRSSLSTRRTVGQQFRPPNIVKVHDFGLTDTGQPYKVMDLVEGTSLSQVLRVGRNAYSSMLIILSISAMLSSTPMQEEFSQRSEASNNHAHAYFRKAHAGETSRFRHLRKSWTKTPIRQCKVDSDRRAFWQARCI